MPSPKTKVKEAYNNESACYVIFDFYFCLQICQKILYTNISLAGSTAKGQHKGQTAFLICMHHNLMSNMVHCFLAFFLQGRMRRARLEELQKDRKNYMFTAMFLSLFSFGRIWLQRRSLEYLTGGLAVRSC